MTFFRGRQNRRNATTVPDGVCHCPKREVFSRRLNVHTEGYRRAKQMADCSTLIINRF